MRIAIIGHQDFGKTVLEAFLARKDEVAGVFCAPEKEGARSDPLKTAALEKGLKLFQFASSRAPEAHTALRDLKVDLGVMAYVLQFAPQEFVRIPRLGTIQYHPSLLPRYRGPSSINWPIARGDERTGLTIFRPTDGLDPTAYPCLSWRLGHPRRQNSSFETGLIISSFQTVSGIYFDNQ